MEGFEVTEPMAPDNFASLTNETARPPTGPSEVGTTDNHLVLFVLADDKHVSGEADCFNPLSDITWLQFIDGLDMRVVVGDEGAFVDAVALDSDAPGTGIWLVDDSGTVHSQWALPSERRDVLSIGRSVERTIDSWGEAQ